MDWGDFPAETPAATGAGWSAFPAEPQQPAPAAPAAPPSVWSRMGTGMMDPFYGGAQIGARMSDVPLMSPETPMVPPGQTSSQNYAQSVDAATKEREQQYQASRNPAVDTGGWGPSPQAGVDYARLAGNMLSPFNFAVPGGAPESVAGAALMGAGRGALMGAMQPATSDNFAKEKALQVGGGTIGGALLGPPANWLGSKIAGAVSPDVQAMRDAGVQMSAGQQGGALARANEALGARIPVAKNVLETQQRNAIDSFNLASTNQALKQIGDSLPDGVAAGHEALTAAHQKVSDFYQGLMPSLTFAPDNQYLASLAQIEAQLPKSVRGDFSDIIDPTLVNSLTGDALKKVDSDLGTWAARYNKSGITNPNHDALGDALDNVRDLMRDQMIRTNPDSVGPLNAADKAFAMMKVIDRAGKLAGRNESVFTPGQLVSAGGQARGTSEKQFVEGNALLQPFAEAANRVIGSNRGVGSRPASAADLLLTDALGTAIGAGGLAGAGAAQEGNGPDWLKYGAMAGVPALMFTRGGQKLLSLGSPGGLGRSALGGLLQPAPAAAGLLGGY